MTSRNPVGGPHRQNMQTPDENWFIQMCKDCQVTTATCLDAAALTGRLLREGGVPYAIYRAWTFEPNPGDRTGDALKQFAAEVYGQLRNMVSQCGDPSVHINLNCEQGHSPSRIRMYTEIMKLNAADPHGPIGIVFLNDFIGGIPIGFWGEPNEFEQDYFIEFIKTFDQYRNLRLANGTYAHVFGVHNYTSQFPWIAVNGGEERNKPINWTTANSIVIDWNKAQDHLGREYQGIRRALKYTWNNTARVWSPSASTPKRGDGTYVEPPWFIWTEALLDDVTGVPIFASPIDHNQRPRGYHTMKTWLERTFAPDPHGLTLAKFSKWTWDKICSAEAGNGYVIGWNLYTLGDTGAWESFNTGRREGTDGPVDPDYDYWNAMKTYRVEMPEHFFKIPTTQPPTQPNKPSNAANPVTFTAPAAFKLRMEGDTSAQPIGTIQAGETITAYRVPETNNDNELWHFVERAVTPPNEATQGYSAVPLPVDPEPQPPQYAVQLTADQEAVVLANQDAIQSAVESTRQIMAEGKPQRSNFKQPMHKPSYAYEPVRVKVVFTGTGRKLMSGPGKEYKQRGLVRNGETLVMWMPSIASTQDESRWRWVEQTSAGDGWFCIEDIGFMTPDPRPKAAEADKTAAALRVYQIPVMLRIEADNEEAASLLARHYASKMDSEFQQLRIDAKLLEVIEQIKSVRVSIPFPEEDSTA